MGRLVPISITALVTAPGFLPLAIAIREISKSSAERLIARVILGLVV
jgi:Cu/Ag efflux pump CusA